MDKNNKSKSFVLYGDNQQQFEMLSDADAGILIKAIFQYVNTGTEKELSPVLQMAFSFIRGGLDRNAAKYDDICERRKEYGRRGGMAKASKCQQKLASAGYNDNKNIPDNDNGNDSGSDTIPPISPKGGTPADKPPNSQRFTPPSVEEVRAYCEERHNGIDPQRFVDFYEAKGWMLGKNKMKNWKAAVRTWEQREIGKEKELSEFDKRTQEYEALGWSASNILY